MYTEASNQFQHFPILIDSALTPEVNSAQLLWELLSFAAVLSLMAMLKDAKQLQSICSTATL